MKTLQELFDIGVGGVLKQSKPSRDVLTGQCLYDGGNGCHCAVGHIIKPTDGSPINPDLEGAVIARIWHTSWADDARLAKLTQALVAAGVNVDDADTQGLLIQLQAAHDDVNDPPTAEHFIAEFKRLAARVADRFKLSKAVLS